MSINFFLLDFFSEKNKLIFRMLVKVSLILVSVIILASFLLLNKSASIKMLNLNRYSELTSKRQNTISQNPNPNLNLKGEEVIPKFVNYLSEKKIPEAMDLMSANLKGNKNNQQIWKEQFKNFKNIELKLIEPILKENWTKDFEEYKVILDLSFEPGATSAQIPNYGWDVGGNYRFIILRKISGAWLVDSIGTGP